jgi:hypothetical protein
MTQNAQKHNNHGLDNNIFKEIKNWPHFDFDNVTQHPFLPSQVLQILLWFVAGIERVLFLERFENFQNTQAQLLLGCGFGSVWRKNENERHGIHTDKWWHIMTQPTRQKGKERKGKERKGKERKEKEKKH